MQGKTFEERRSDSNSTNMDGQPAQNTFFENFWGTADDEEIKPEVREFYKKFLERNQKLKAEVVSYDIREDEYKKKYTVYNIKVTLDHFSYTIPKRFSEFDDFYKNLKDKYPDFNLNQINFPSKTLFSFSGTSIETIEKRKAGFNEFVQLLVTKCKSEGIIDFLEFLGVKNHSEKVFNNQVSPLSSEKQYITNTQEVNKLVEYVDLLNKNQDGTSKILQEMQNFYIDKRPKIASDFIRAILVGKPKSQGLVHFCGKIDPNANLHLICSVGLKFLQALMDHQSCQDADQFIAIFGGLDPKLIDMLNLTEHIEGKKQCKAAALKLAHTYLSRNPTLALTDILKTPSAVQDYEKWKLHTFSRFVLSEGSQISQKNEEIDEDKESVEDCDMSPEESMNSLEDITEKTYTGKKISWTEFYKDDIIKIKYNQSRYLSISLKTSASLENCANQLVKGIDYRILCDESTIIKTLEDDTKVHMVKIRMDMPPWKHFVFVNERIIKEESTEQIIVLEKPGKHSAMFSNTDLSIKRFATIIIKQNYKSKDRTVKVKMLVKNLEEGSKELQSYLIREGDGRLLIESCQKFLEDVEKQSK